MVFYFKSNIVRPPVTIYMGKDKFENEELIKHGLPTDVWFHVDKLSSAHVYLRLNEGETWDNIPEEVLEDCAQLTKANSIEGNKKDNITVIYTPWSNLKKTPGMATGQVAFFKDKTVKSIHVQERINPIINRLNKTKIEKYPDLAKEKIEYTRELKRQKHKIEQQQRTENKNIIDEARKLKELSSYDYVMTESNMVSNSDMKDEYGDKDPREIEEDFM